MSDLRLVELVLGLLLLIVLLGVIASAYFIPALASVVQPDVSYPPWRNVAVVAWAGIRGGESLAPALALPLGAEGTGFPERSLIIFLTFAVILERIPCGCRVQTGLDRIANPRPKRKTL